MVRKDGPLQSYFKSMELRLGTTDMSGSAQERFGEENPLVGCQPVGGGVTTSWVHTFNLAEAAAGRYLTLQPVSDTYLMVDEISVYTQ